MLNSRHPAMQIALRNWEQMVHSHMGERIVKEQGERYLPPTPAMIYDGMKAGQPGKAAYDAYLQRAVFPGEVRHAVEGLIGIMHRKSPSISVPERMKPLVEKMTLDGEDAQTLLRRINEAQLVTGRMGLLLEVPDDRGPDALPFVATYQAHTIINWSVWRPQNDHEEYDIVVLDETEEVQQPSLDWKRVEKYRVLVSSESARRRGMFVDQLGQATGYAAGRSESSTDPASVVFTTPSLAGRTLSKIPFVVVNSMDLHPDPTLPPLLGLSDICLAIYRMEADYRTGLFMQGQETLVIIGAEESDTEDGQSDERIGAGAVLRLPDGADAKYVGVSADGLTAMRAALDADYIKAGERGMRLMDTSEGGGQQSGDALRQRIAAKTASLVTIAEAGAAGLKRILQHAAELMGENPEDVHVEPNVDFANEQMTGREMLEWAQAKSMGAPISWRTIHDIMAIREITSMTYEDELAEIYQEAPLAAGQSGAGGAIASGAGRSDPRGSGRRSEDRAGG